MTMVWFIDFLPFCGFLIFSFSLTAKVFILKKSGVKVSSASPKNGKSIFFIYPVFGIIFLIWLLEIVKPVFQNSFPILPKILTNLLFQSFVLKVTGFGTIIFSLILLILTLIHFKSSLRFGLDENNQGKLIINGIFSISRNPFFLSLIFYFLGILLVFPNLFFISFAVLSIVSIHLFILKEEKFMLKVYGEEYENYRARVKRYFNF